MTRDRQTGGGWKEQHADERSAGKQQAPIGGDPARPLDLRNARQGRRLLRDSHENLHWLLEALFAGKESAVLRQINRRAGAESRAMEA